MEVDPARVWVLLVGLGDVEVLGVDDEAGGPMRVHVRRRARDRAVRAAGGRCGPTASGRWIWWTSRRWGGLFGWRCARRGCPAGAVTEQDGEIAPERERLTARAGRWATRRAGRGRPVRDVSEELGCSRHPVNMSVRRWGEALLEADTERIGGTHAMGLDEHLMRRRGRFRTKARSTGIVEAARGQLVDIVPARTAKAPTRRLLGRPRGRRAGVRWAAPGLSGPYRAAFDTAPPHAAQAADPSASCASATTPSTRSAAAPRTRRWGAAAANTTRSTGRASCSCRPLSVTDNGRARLRGLLDAGDPHGEVRDARRR